MKKEEVHELLCQALETEQGGVQVYSLTILGDRAARRNNQVD